MHLDYSELENMFNAVILEIKSFTKGQVAFFKRNSNQLLKRNYPTSSKKYLGYHQLHLTLEEYVRAIEKSTSLSYEIKLRFPEFKLKYDNLIYSIIENNNDNNNMIFYESESDLLNDHLLHIKNSDLLYEMYLFILIMKLLIDFDIFTNVLLETVLKSLQFLPLYFMQEYAQIIPKQYLTEKLFREFPIEMADFISMRYSEINSVKWNYEKLDDEFFTYIEYFYCIIQSDGISTMVAKKFPEFGHDPSFCFNLANLSIYGAMKNDDYEIIAEILKVLFPLDYKWRDTHFYQIFSLLSNGFSNSESIIRLFTSIIDNTDYSQSYQDFMLKGIINGEWGNQTISKEYKNIAKKFVKLYRSQSGSSI